MATNVWIHSATATESSAASVTTTPPVERADLVDAWCRVQWSAPDPSEWHIRLKIESDESAELIEFENHCTSDSSTGAFTFVSGQPQLAIDTSDRTNGGAVRVHFRAPTTAHLVCELVSPNQIKRLTRVAVTDVLAATSPLEHAVEATEDAPPVKWSVQRSLDDVLRISLRQPTTVMSIGEPLQFSLGINRLQSLAAGNVSLRYSLRRVDNGETVSSQSWDLALNEFGSAAAIDVTATKFPAAGVYELRGVVESSDEGIWGKLRRHKAIVAEAGVALVVVDKNQPTVAATSEAIQWRELQTIHPSDPRQWTWSGIVPATTDALLSTIQTHPHPELATANHAGQTISTLGPGASFETKLPVDRVGTPHLITLRFPAGSRTRFRLDVVSHSLPLQPRKSFAINENAIGIDHSPWSSHSFVYYPGGDNETLRLTNLDTRQSASFHSIRVARGPNTFAERHADSPQPSMVALSLTNFGWVEQLTSDFDTRSNVGTWLPETLSLYRLSIAAKRLAEYVHASGMNTVVIPANQGGRVWFASNELSRRYVRPAESANQLATALHVLDATGLGVIVGFEPTMSLTQVETGIRERPIEGDAVLRTRRTPLDARQYDPLDLSVRSSLDRLLDDLLQVCQNHTCFRGLSLGCDHDSHLNPITVEDRLKVAALKKFLDSRPDSTLSLATPEAVRQFELWRHGEGRAEFESWLFAAQRDYLDRVAKRVGHTVLLRLPASQVNLLGDTGLCSSAWPIRSSSLVPVIEHQRASLGSLSKDFRAAHRLTSIATMEPDHARPLAISVSELDGAETLPSAVFQESLALDLARLVDRVHPKMVIIQSNVVTGSVSPLLASSLRSIAVAPMTELKAVVSRDPHSQPAHLYQHATTGALLAINVAPWTSEIDIITDTEVSWVPDAVASSLVAAAKSAGVTASETVVPNARRMRLAPGEIKWIQTASRTPVQIADWTSRPAGGEGGVLRVKEAVTQVVERLGVFSETPDYNVLANGGFEQSSPVGIVGWLAAQHPPGAVRVDAESIEGTQSVCLTTDTRTNTRTWIVSETIPVPATGRLAISLACRGELSDTAPATTQDVASERPNKKLRITIEGTRGGEPVRFASDIEVPADGRWQSRRIVLELDGLDESHTEGLRLAIDSFSDGRVWIDDVHLHDWFPLASERNDLQGQSFLAVQGLQRGNLVPASRLLRNDWARYLLTIGSSSPLASPHHNGEVSPPPTKTNVETTPELNTTIPTTDAPGMAERLRSWLPRRLRF